MEEELGLVGATADDTEAELIRSICETELLDGKCGCHQGILAVCLCERADTVGDRSLKRKAVSFGKKHCHFPWCQFPCRLSVSWLCLSGGGCSVVKVSQPLCKLTVVCSSSGINGVIVLKARCTNSTLMLTVFIPML